MKFGGTSVDHAVNVADLVLAEIERGAILPGIIGAFEQQCPRPGLSAIFRCRQEDALLRTIIPGDVYLLSTQPIGKGNSQVAVKGGGCPKVFRVIKRCCFRPKPTAYDGLTIIYPGSLESICDIFNVSDVQGALRVKCHIEIRNASTQPGDGPF